jgi:hypothetical protein
MPPIPELLLDELLEASAPPLPPVAGVFGSSLQPAPRATALIKLMRIAYFMKETPVK